MKAHDIMIETYQGIEETIAAYGSRDAIIDGLCIAIATLGRPFTWEPRSYENGTPYVFFGYIGRGFREVFLSFNPPDSYAIVGDGGEVADPPDATKDWCVCCSTDVRIWYDAPKGPYLALYEPGLLLRDLTRAGLTCILDSGIGPGRPNAASIPRERVVLLDAPEDWAGADTIAGAWAEIVGPGLTVRKVPSLKRYESLCGPGFKRRNADEQARDLEETLSLLQEIAVASSATAPSSSSATLLT